MTRHGLLSIMERDVGLQCLTSGPVDVQFYQLSFLAYLLLRRPAFGGPETMFDSGSTSVSRISVPHQLEIRDLPRLNDNAQRHTTTHASRTNDVQNFADDDWTESRCALAKHFHEFKAISAYRGMFLDPAPWSFLFFVIFMSVINLIVEDSLFILDLRYYRRCRTVHKIRADVRERSSKSLLTFSYVTASVS